MVNSATLLEVLLTKKLTQAKSMLPQKTKPKPKDEDEEDDSFWVYSEKEKNILFKLDKHMKIMLMTVILDLNLAVKKKILFLIITIQKMI